MHYLLLNDNALDLCLFPNGALVHFAVNNSEARMTTRLEGAATAFLPFNFDCLDSAFSRRSA